jgi:hypothetical protein
MTGDELQAAEQTVAAMEASGDLVGDELQKCRVTIAARWLTEQHDAEKSLIALNTCSPEYLQHTICQHMEADDSFAALITEFSYRLLQIGMSEVDEQQPTMAVGRA